MIEGPKIADARWKLSFGIRERLRQIAIELVEPEDDATDEEMVARIQLAYDLTSFASKIGSSHPEQRTVAPRGVPNGKRDP